ncbi:MAG: hypothetical protein ACXAB7_21785 [Candidatus Kariarchaeaceae archaeon]
MEKIREAREEQLWAEKYTLSDQISKRIISYTPKGPMTILF